MPNWNCASNEWQRMLSTVFVPKCGGCSPTRGYGTFVGAGGKAGLSKGQQSIGS